MADKPTLSFRIPLDLHERFEVFRQRQGMNKTEAGEHLLELGLDVETDGAEAALAAAQEGAVEEIDTAPLTRTEEWCRDRFVSWFAGTLLSGATTLALMLVFSIATFWPGLDPSFWLPMQVLAVVIFGGVVIFVSLAFGTLITGLLLNTGYAQRIDLWRERGTGSQEASA